jgi:cyclic-di-GMP-binding protein
LKSKLAKRGVDIQCLDINQPEKFGKEVRQVITLRQGLDTDTARKIVKYIKDTKIKVQVSIQGEKVRVNGKKRDDLQQAIQQLKEHNFNLPLQYNNFRD